MSFFKKIKNRFFKPEEPSQIIQIIPRVYVTEYPTETKIPFLKKFFKNLPAPFKIWNISEQEYDSSFFDFNVMHHVRPGHPNPGVLDILVICSEISNWLDSNPTHQAFIHCQKSFARSALVLCFFLTFIRVAKSADEAMELVLKKLKSDLLRNHRIYQRHCESLLTLKNLNQHPLRLKKVILSEAPQVRLLKEHAEDPFLVSNLVFKPYLQVFVDNKVVFNSIEKYFHFFSSVFMLNLRELKHNQLEFDLSKSNIVLEKDFLLRIRHFLSSKVRYPVLRLMLSPTMVEGGGFHILAKPDLGKSSSFITLRL